MASWVEKKEKLVFLIKSISNSYGGDDPDELELYIKGTIGKYKTNLDQAIDCFTDIASRMPNERKKIPIC